MKAIYSPTIAELERDFIVHKLWTARDPQAYMRQECWKVRAAVSTTPTGFSRSDFEALPKLEIVIATSILEIREGRSSKLLAGLRAFFSGKPLLDLVIV
jgi:hypothetical protein